MAIPAIIMAAMRAIGIGAEAGAAATGSGSAIARGVSQFAKANPMSMLSYSSSGTPMPQSPNVQAAQRQMVQQKLANEQVEKSTKSWEMLKSRLSQTNQTLAFVNVNVHQFAQYIQAVPGMLTKLATTWADFVAAAARPIQNLVRIANPAQADAFDRAMNDAYGVVGRLLIPVMDSFTRLARRVGNEMAKLEPVFKPAIKAVAQFIDTLGAVFSDVVNQNKDIFISLANALEVTAQAASVFLQAMKPVRWAFGQLISIASKFSLFGILGHAGAFNPNATAEGSAARQAKFQSAKGLSDEAIKNALMMGIGAEDVPKKQLSTLEQIRDFLSQRFGTPEKAGRSIGGIVGGVVGGRVGAEIGSEVGGQIGEAAGAHSDDITDIGDKLLRITSPLYGAYSFLK